MCCQHRWGSPIAACGFLPASLGLRCSCLRRITNTPSRSASLHGSRSRLKTTRVADQFCHCLGLWNSQVTIPVKSRRRIRIHIDSSDPLPSFSGSVWQETRCLPLRNSTGIRTRRSMWEAVSRKSHPLRRILSKAACCEPICALSAEAMKCRRECYRAPDASHSSASRKSRCHTRDKPIECWCARCQPFAVADAARCRWGGAPFRERPPPCWTRCSQALAIGAVAGVDELRGFGDLVADLAALAAARLWELHALSLSNRPDVCAIIAGTQPRWQLPARPG